LSCLSLYLSVSTNICMRNSSYILKENSTKPCMLAYYHMIEPFSKELLTFFLLCVCNFSLIIKGNSLKLIALKVDRASLEGVIGLFEYVIKKDRSWLYMGDSYILYQSCIVPVWCVHFFNFLEIAHSSHKRWGMWESHSLCMAFYNMDNIIFVAISNKLWLPQIIS